MDKQKNSNLIYINIYDILYIIIYILSIFSHISAHIIIYIWDKCIGRIKKENTCMGVEGRGVIESNLFPTSMSINNHLKINVTYLEI